MQGLCVFLLRHVNFVTPDKIQIHSCSTVIIVAYECVPSKMRAHGYSWCVVDTDCRVFDSANGLTGFLFHALLRDGQNFWVGSVAGGTVEY